MARWLPWLLLLCSHAVSACGARTDTAETIEGADETDSGTRITDAGVARPDTFVPPPPPPPVMCRGRDDVGGFFGAVPLGDIAFPFVVAGIEEPGTHSCPRLFIRAGEDPTFSGSYLEIQVPYATDGSDLDPGPREGFMDVYIGGEVWSEPLFVDVLRADGLFDPDVPREERRAIAVVSHHDATTDLEGIVMEAEYCYDFAICI